MVPLSYIFRSLVQRRQTTIATALGISLVVFVLSSSIMLAEGVNAAMGLSADPEDVIVLRKGSDTELGSTLERTHVGMVLAGPGVHKDNDGKPLGAAELVVVTALEKLGGGAGQVSNVQVRGLDERSMTLRPSVEIVEGRTPAVGSNEALVGARLRGRFPGLELGESFVLRGSQRLNVVGVFEANGTSAESEIWVDGDLLRTAFRRESVVSSVRIQLTSPEKFEAFQTYVESEKSRGLKVMKEKSFLEDQSQGMAIFVSALGTLIVIFFSLGATLGAMITMYSAVSQRKKEIGVLRALGFSRFSILSAFVLEALCLALVGGLVGAGASLIMGSFEFSMVNFATWSEVVFRFTPTPRILVASLAVAIIMGLVGGFFPALRAARTSPIEAMRS